MSGTHERMRTHAGDERDVALGRTHRHEVLHRHARAHGGGARFGYLNHGDAPRDERWFGCALGLQGAGCLTNKGERGGVERRGERMNLGKIKIPSFFPPPCSEESSKEPSVSVRAEARSPACARSSPRVRALRRHGCDPLTFRGVHFHGTNEDLVEGRSSRGFVPFDSW